jgi:uncharacterized protein YukE
MPIDFTQLSIDELRGRFQKLQDKLERLEKTTDQQIENQREVTAGEYRDVKESREKELLAAQRAFDDKQRAYEEISQQYQQAKGELDEAQARLREAARLANDVDRELSRESSRARKETQRILQQEVKDIRVELRKIAQILEKAGRQEIPED